MHATDPQQSYLAILFTDCGFDRTQRNIWLSEQTGRAVKYIDELTVAEASKAIDALRELKDEKAS